MKNYLKNYGFVLAVLIITLYGFNSCTTQTAVPCPEFSNNQNKAKRQAKINKATNYLTHIFSNSHKNTFVKKDKPEKVQTSDIVNQQIAEIRNQIEISQIDQNTEPALLASSQNVITPTLKLAGVKEKIKMLQARENIDLNTYRKEYREIKKEVENNFVNSNLSNDNLAPKGDGSGYSIAALVLGIVGLVLAGLICGALAIIFGGIGLSKKQKKGMAIAGIILGAIDIVGALLVISTM